MTYLDSSALVAVYVTERFSGRARKEAQVAGRIPFTALHELEVGNALRVLHGRGILTGSEFGLVVAQLEEDVRSERLAATRIDLFRVFESARELSRAHAATLLCRSSDVLHVAAALELECRRLVSGDDRQLALGELVGMEPVDIKRAEARGRQRGTPPSRRPRHRST